MAFDNDSFEAIFRQKVQQLKSNKQDQVINQRSNEEIRKHIKKMMKAKSEV